MSKILVTGSRGLVGKGLVAALRARGHEVSGLDLRGAGAERGDTRCRGHVAAAVAHVDGVVHLAAVSRVVWGERDPGECWATNVTGTQNLLEACVAASASPWVLFASSREVYGQPAVLPATEDAPLAPVNIYGRSKVAGEELMAAYRGRGVRTAIVRLANVYGSTADHPDRVVPAFARAASAGQELRVDGPDHTFDFTHLDDAIDGLGRLVALLDAGAADLPPIHLLPGSPVTLGELARLAVGLAGTRAPLRLAPPRTYDVSRFYGDPGRAARLLGGWVAEVPLRAGVQRLIEEFRSLEVAS